MNLIGTRDPLAIVAVNAIQTGDLPRLQRLLAEHPALARVRIGDDGPEAVSRTLLHIVSDWPGHRRNGAQAVNLLVAAGADVNARARGTHGETPLHWAASCDDVAVLDALLDAGADIEADGAVIGGGTALADARAFRQWHAAQRLIERGAQVTLADAATLGLLDRIRDILVRVPAPNQQDINAAFWGACHGDRLDAARFLLDRGAELNWIADWEPMTPLDAARRSEAGELAGWLIQRGAREARELR